MGWADDFATGFAAGFVPAYEKSFQQESERQDEMFSATVESWTETQQARNEARREHRQRLRRAQTVAADIGVDVGLVYRQADTFDWDFEKTREAIEQRGFDPVGGSETQTSAAMSEADTQSDPNAFDIETFRARMRQSESSGDAGAYRENEDGRTYAGLVQMGEARLQDYNNATGAGLTPESYRMMDEEAQTEVENWHFRDINQRINREGLDQFIGQTINGTRLTRDSIVAMSHLGGFDGAKNYLESGGEQDPSDELGTSLSDYARRFGEPGDPAAQQTDEMLSSDQEVTREEALEYINSGNGAVDARIANFLESRGELEDYVRYARGEDTGLQIPETQFRMRPPRGERLDFNDLPDLEQIRDLDRYAAAESQISALVAAEGEEALPPGYLDSFRAHRSVVESIDINQTAGQYLEGVSSAAEAITARNRAEADGATPEVLDRIDQTLREIEENAFEPPGNSQEAAERYRAAIRMGDPDEAERLRPFLPSGQTEFAKMRIVPRDGSVGEVVSVTTTVDPETGETVYQDLSGNFIDTQSAVIAPLTEEMRDAQRSVNNGLGKDIRDLYMQRRALTGLGELGLEMAQIYEGNPEVGTRVASIVSSISSTTREGVSAYNILRRAIGEDGEITQAQAEDLLRREGYLERGQSLAEVADSLEVEDILDESFSDLGQARKVMEAKMIMAIFRVGGLEGQSGRSMSDKTFQHFEQFLRTPARTPERFRQNFGDYLNNMYNTLTQQENQIRNHPSVRAFEQQFEYTPVELTSLGDVIDSNPTYRQAFDYFMEGGSLPSTEGQNTPETSTAVESPAPATEESTSVDSQTGRLVTEEMAASAPNLQQYIGQRVQAVPNGDGTYRIEVVE